MCHDVSYTVRVCRGSVSTSHLRTGGGSSCPEVCRCLFFRSIQNVNRIYGAMENSCSIVSKCRSLGFGGALCGAVSWACSNALSGTDGVVNVGRGSDRHASSGESRVVAQHAIGLGAMIPSGSVRLDGERGRDAEREHQQHGDDGTTSHPETSHGEKNPSWNLARQQSVNSTGPFSDKGRA